MSLAGPDDIPLADDLDAEEESPFRRRQKAVQVRRSRFSRAWRIVGWTLVCALVLLPAGYLGYRLTVFARGSPHFTLTSAEDVMISGNRFVSREDILSVISIPAAGKLRSGVNIFRLPLDEKRKQVEAIPWVRSATLSRAYPHRLAVHVVEREPVAFVNVAGRVKLVDGEGVLLEKPAKAAFDFPVLTGLDAAEGLSERQTRLAVYLEFWRELATEASRAGWLISEVDLTDPDDLKAVLVYGLDTILVHFGRSDFQERFQNFLTLLPELRKTNAKIDSVDLRYRNQIVVNPQASRPRNAAGPGPSGTWKE